MGIKRRLDCYTSCIVMNFVSVHLAYNMSFRVRNKSYGVRQAKDKDN